MAHIQWLVANSQPALPRVIKYNSTLVLTVGFELPPAEPGVGGWEGFLPPTGPAGDELYLQAGFVSRAGRETTEVSLSITDLHPQLRTGQRFSKNFSPESQPGLSAFWFKAITENVHVVTGGGPSFGYALSFFVRIERDGQATEFTYAAPEPLEIPSSRAVANDTVCILVASE
jgi:hypothetical protein